jgi:O-antigen/teichoic acid export membrane protein
MSLQMKMARGAAWTLGARLAIKVLGILSMLILVRLLTPADFGLVALATALVAGLQLIKTFGFEAALIQDQKAGVNKYNAAWTLNIGFSLLVAALLLIGARPASEFYSDERLQNILYVLAFSMVIDGFENIGIVNFRKYMAFHKDFVFQLTRKAIGFLVTVPMAFVLRNHWALIAGILASSLAGAVSSYLMQPFRPRLATKGITELFHFSKWLALNNFLYFVRHRAADFVLGRVAGPKAVGLFSISYEISHLVTAELVAPINRAVFPGYAKLGHDLIKLRIAYLQVMSVIALVSIPAATGIAAIADLLVPIMFGEKWIATIPLIQILAFAGTIAILETNIGSAYVAIGRPQILTRIYSVFAVTLLSFLIFLTPRYGATGAAMASLFAGIANIPLQVIIMRRTFGISPADLARVFFRPIGASAAMFWAVRLFIGQFGAANSATLQPSLLLVSILLGAAVFVGVDLFLWALTGRPSGIETFVIDRIRRIVRA